MFSFVMSHYIYRSNRHIKMESFCGLNNWTRFLESIMGGVGTVQNCTEIASVSCSIKWLAGVTALNSVIEVSRRNYFSQHVGGKLN